MSIKKTLSLNNHQQLLDLNGDTTNFDLTFTATSKDNSPFDMIVVDQTTLDNTSKLEYKRVNGTISGNIIADKNVYQNYFICLKSEKPCEIDITIDKKEIAPKPHQPHQQLSNSSSFTHQPIKPNGTNWKMIFIAIVAICGGIFLYYKYNTKTGEVVKEENFSSEPVPVNLSSLPIEVQTTNFGFGGRKANESLIARLNSIPMK